MGRIFLKHFLIRLLIISIPLGILYGYSQMAFEANRQKEHTTDVGLGVAIILFFLLCFMAIGLIADFIIRLRTKQKTIALSNLPFLALFSIPILYIHCQMGDYCENCFCSWFINLF